MSGRSKHKELAYQTPRRQSMKRRDFLQTGALACAAAALATPANATSADRSETRPVASPKTFELDELTIEELQNGMKSGKHTSQSITEKYLQRIEDIDKRGPAINS